ncbi:MAG: response regulator transcription factor, partial [Eubacteriales bacterium]|nr:response regulator transcription factor [Eubacteriales bacterium]
NTNESVFKNGGLEIDYSAAVVKLDGEELHLMPLEYSLLCLLAQNVGKVLTYQFILEKVWQNGVGSDISSLRVYMASLRKKLEKDKEKPTYIQTHIGIGYRMLNVED